MAHGAPDYWPYVTAGLPVPLSDQVLWVETDARDIAGLGNAFMIDYTVPAGEELYVTGGYVSTDFARIQRYALSVDLVAWGTYYFDTFAHLPLNPSAMVRAVAGEHFYVRVYNDDALQHSFAVTVYGFRVTMVPGTPPPVGLGLLLKGAGI